MTTIDLDPFQDGPIPVELHRALRATCPVARVPVGWFLTRHADVATGVREVDRYLSSYREPGVVVPLEEQLISEMAEPRHGQVRKIINAVIAHHKAMRCEPFIRDLAHEHLGGLLERGGGDLVAEYASPIPVNVIAMLMGVPRADWPLFRRWSDEVVEGTYVSRNRTERGEGFGGGHPEFAAYIDALIAERRGSGERPDDFVTRLLETEIDGLRLTDVEVRTQLINLILGGNETTRHLIANLLARVVADPSLLRALKDDKALVARAVEESLRMEPPVLQMFRTIQEDTEQFGCPMQAGEKIVFSVTSANRDEDVFADPDQFRLDRENFRDHLTFGDGPHICPGQALARLEGRIALEVFVELVGTAEPEPGWERRKVPVFWASGPVDLPVRLSPA
jgi:cytochrome P450